MMNIESKITHLQNKSRGTWEKKFNELRKWIKKYKRYPTKEENSNLYLWISTQRNLRKNSKINKYRKNKLNSINFIWNQHDYNWHKKYKQLSDFKKDKGYWPKQKNKTEPEHTLAVWMLDTRIKYKKNKLTEHQLELLNKIGFPLKNLIRRRWETFYGKLTNWLKTYKEFPNYLGKRKDERNLYINCLYKYNKYVNNKLEDYQKKQLDLIGFSKFKEVNEQIKRDVIKKRSFEIWEKNYKNLYHFVKTAKRLPEPKYEKERKLSYWICKQRSKYKKNELNQFQIKKLNELNIFFGTDTISLMVSKLINELKIFRERNPNRWPTVSQKRKRDERLLAKKLHYCRNKYRINKLSNEEIQLFENMNYSLKQTTPPYKSFNERIIEINKLRKKYGKIKVSGDTESNSVYQWVIKQRKKYRNGKLTDEQIAILKKNNLLETKRVNS